jgi:beta-barrel assembly-enhancing protease
VRWRSLLAPALASVLLALGSATPFSAARAADDEETQAGAQLFSELKAQGEVVRSSPLYDVLRPIAGAITKTVQPRYPYPIHFYIVHEQQPNAFAAPGGNIYVVDALFYFVKNREELEGTLCHESSHLLHHDSLNLMKREEAIRRRAIAATIVLGPSIGTILAATAISHLDELHYSRAAEEAADITGSDTCAASGFNPWGLAWLFQDFSNADLQAPPEFLSDHPDDKHRIEQLEKHFAAKPAVFAGFSNQRSTASPLHVPANEQEQFYR